MVKLVIFRDPMREAGFNANANANIYFVYLEYVVIRLKFVNMVQFIPIIYVGRVPD